MSMDELAAFLAARLKQDGRPVVTARMRREIDAKQALIAEWRDHELERGDTASYTDGLADGLKLAVKYFAAIWDGHPDYRQEWKPET